MKSCSISSYDLEAMSYQDHSEVRLPHNYKDDEGQQSQGSADRFSHNAKKTETSNPTSKMCPPEVGSWNERARSPMTEQLLHEAALSFINQKEAPAESISSAMACALAKHHDHRQASWPVLLFSAKSSKYPQLTASRDRCIQESRRVQRQTRKNRRSRSYLNDYRQRNYTVRKTKTPAPPEISQLIEMMNFSLSRALHLSPSLNEDQDGDDSIATNGTSHAWSTQRECCLGSGTRAIDPIIHNEESPCL